MQNLIISRFFFVFCLNKAGVRQELCVGYRNKRKEL